MTYTFKDVDSGDTENIEIFQGIMESGLKQGKGVYKTKNWSYDGEYSQNLKSGFGILTFPDGSKYEGTGLYQDWLLNSL